MKSKIVEDMDVELTLSQVMKNLKKQEDCILSGYGLTHFHSRYVMTIQKYKSLTMNELTSIMGMDKANTTRVVKDLLNENVVEKYGGERKFKLSLTEKGKEIAEFFKHRVTNFLKKVFRDFSESEIHTFRSLLEKMFFGLKNAIEG